MRFGGMRGAVQLADRPWDVKRGILPIRRVTGAAAIVATSAKTTDGSFGDGPSAA